MNGSKHFFFLISILLLLSLVGCDRKTSDNGTPAQSLEKKENLLIAPEKRLALPAFHLNSIQDGSSVSNKTLNGNATATSEEE